ncbi:MAG: Ig-like domain-containing protein [Eubacteriales bacterium]|nr:Ig-like domain-containing protein [Eubacteriales bacterium]
MKLRGKKLTALLLAGIMAFTPALSVYAEEFENEVYAVESEVISEKDMTEEETWYEDTEELFAADEEAGFGEEVEDEWIIDVEPVEEAALDIMLDGEEPPAAPAQVYDNQVADDIADQEATADDFVFTGGTGKVTITCPKITIKDGHSYADIAYSSKNYTKLRIGETIYENPELGTKSSTFKSVPVELNKEMTIYGTTTAMSKIQEIEYKITITKDLATLEKKAVSETYNNQVSEDIADQEAVPDEFAFSGGTGRVKITCPKITIKDGHSYADIAYSSKNYTKLRIGETIYENPELGTKSSTFKSVPVELNKEMTIYGTTTAMSKIQEIEYKITITKDLATLEKKAVEHQHVSEELKAIEATCTEKGLTAGEKCSECGEVLVEQKEIPAKGHSYGEWKITREATEQQTGLKERTCTICRNKETEEIAKLQPSNKPETINPTIEVNAETILLKSKQSTTAFKVTGLAEGDRVVSYESDNPKLFTVTSDGKIKAKNKTGKANLTITLASGLKKTVKVSVQAKAVQTKKITGLTKKLTLKKGEKLTLHPVLAPITSIQKITYSTSDKKIATVNKKGVITAKKAGKAKITVTSGKKKVVINITVREKTTTVTVH